MEVPEQIKKIVEKHGLDGVFVGSLSGDLGGSRLLQVKFFGKDQEGFVLEKVTRISGKKNIKKAVQKLVTSSVATLK